MQDLRAGDLPTNGMCDRLGGWGKEVRSVTNQRRRGGIEPLRLSTPLELKSSPGTSPTHPGCDAKPTQIEHMQGQASGAFRAASSGMMRFSCVENLACQMELFFALRQCSFLAPPMVTVAILAQGTNRAVAVTQAFLVATQPSSFPRHLARSP